MCFPLQSCDELEILFDVFGNLKLESEVLGNSLAVQLLRLGAFTAMGLGLIPGWGTKIPQAARPKRKKKRKEVLLTSTYQLTSLSLSYLTYTLELVRYCLIYNVLMMIKRE